MTEPAKVTRPYHRKPQEWSNPLPAANGLLLTLHAWKDAGEAYWSATVEDGGETTASGWRGNC